MNFQHPIANVIVTIMAALEAGDRTSLQGINADLVNAIADNLKPAGGVYLHLFHGRNSVDEDMEDWGFDGPVIGPLEYVHTTYACDVKFACSEAVARKFFSEAEVYSFEPLTEGRIVFVDGLLPLGGKLYGDWSVSGTNQP